MFPRTRVHVSYIAALELELVLNFVSAVIIRHLALLGVDRQIGRQPFPLDGEKADGEVGGE